VQSEAACSGAAELRSCRLLGPEGARDDRPPP
jgi:hypothetical protein